MNRETAFLDHRGRLLGLAYRMLGTMSDAEDIVQDAWIRFSKVETDTLKSAEAYLVTVVTRLCLDRLKSAQRRREVYVGPWLPEPVADCEAISPETALEFADDLSFALLMTLERLTPPERAAFLLHDVFGQPFAAVSGALGKSEAACRQLATRARKAVRTKRETPPASEVDHRKLLNAFSAALASGETERLASLLAEDVVLYSDGGGIKIAALNPIVGADRIARFFTGVISKGRAQHDSVEPVFETINGAPAMLIYVDGALDQTLSIEARNGEIVAIYIVRNPEKLGAIPQC